MVSKMVRCALSAAVSLSFIGEAIASAECDYTKNGLKWTSAVRMNQVQVVGTHNSYHVEAPLEEKASQATLLTSVVNYFYAHPSLNIQAKYQHVRNFELDIFPDPDGGLYAYPLVRKNAGLDPIDQEYLTAPGIKVMHVADADVHVSCHTLIQCLGVLKTWSSTQPDHIPISIMVEFKTADVALVPLGGAPVIPWNNTALLDGLDAEIRSVFSNEQLITADHIRRGNLTLEQSVLKYGWPDLDSARGRFFFTMDTNPGPIRDVYTAGRPNLEGRVLFTNSVPGNADCAFQKLNDPRGATNLANIQAQVKAGYWVRTRSDEPLYTILSNDTTSYREAAFASGAQVISTDFPVYGMSSRWGVDYAVRLPGGKTVQCNPINVHPSCAGKELEPLEYILN